MPALPIGNPDLLEARPGMGVTPDFTPAAAASASARPGKAWAVACLEEGSSPGEDVLASFLINALYLIGDQRIFAYGGLPTGVEDALVRLGHRVESDFRSRKSASRPDRAVALARTLGRGGESEILESLRVMGKSLRPGGLLAFRLIDRDRAWSLAGERKISSGGSEARLRIEFNPDTGRVSARTLDIRGPGTSTTAAAGGATDSLQAFNLSEIRRLLRSAGLALERAYGDWSGGGPEAEGAATGRLIIVASKPRRRRTGGGTGDRGGARPNPGR